MHPARLAGKVKVHQAIRHSGVRDLHAAFGQQALQQLLGHGQAHAA